MNLNPLLLSLLLPLAVHAAQEPFYLGVYTGSGKGEGIYRCAIDSDTGQLSPVTLAIKANNPGYLALSPDGAHLYAVTSDDGGSVEAFSVGGDGALTALNHVTAGGAGPCYVSVDRQGKDVLVANYAGGNVACIPIHPDGTLGVRSAVETFSGSGPDPDRQQQPYAHFIQADATNRFAYACDLGTDHVWALRFDPVAGIFPGRVAVQATVPPGSGPRHLAFGPGQAFAYVNGEMGRNVTVFRHDASTGALTAMQTVPLVPGKPGPEKGITSAEIECHPSGKWIYVSSRGDDIIAVFAIGPDGLLTFVQDAPAGVKVPRGFGIDPSGRWLIAAGQEDGRIDVLAIAPDTGKLTATRQEAKVPAAVDVLFVPQR